MGMGRAFMEAGSKRVIVSLWPVESFSTQRLMELFYAHLAVLAILGLTLVVPF